MEGSPIRMTRWIVGLAAAAAILFFIWYFSSVVTYILVAAVLAIVGKPVVAWIERLRIRGHHAPRWLAALVTLLGMWVLFAALFTLFIPLVAGRLAQLSQVDIGQVIDSVAGPLAALRQRIAELFSLPAEQVPLTETVAKQVQGLLSFRTLNDIVSSLLSVATSAVIALFSITFITFFFLKEERLFPSMVAALFPQRYEENVRRALESTTVLLRRYFTGILAESFILLTFVSVVLMAFGASAQSAFFTGLVVGVLNVIPYVGPLIGFLLALLLGWLTPIVGVGVGSTLLLVGTTVATAQVIDNFVLQPVLYSNRVKAHPLEIFIVILLAGSLAGVVGMLLAIPSYTVLRVFAKEFFYHFKWVRQLTRKL